jgi:hypothetical protein
MPTLREIRTALHKALGEALLHPRLEFLSIIIEIAALIGLFCYVRSASIQAVANQHSADAELMANAPVVLSDRFTPTCRSGRIPETVTMTVKNFGGSIALNVKAIASILSKTEIIHARPSAAKPSRANSIAPPSRALPWR